MNLDAIDFLKKNQVGVIATCNKGRPHAVPIYYHFNTDDECIYFITKEEAQKVKNLKANKSAFFTVYTKSPQVVFRAECKAVLDIKKSLVMTEIISTLVGIHTIQLYQPTPIDVLDKGNMKLIKLKIEGYKFDEYNKEIIPN